MMSLSGGETANCAGRLTSGLRSLRVLSCAMPGSEQVESSSKLERARTRIRLRRRIEAPCGRSPGFNIFRVKRFRALAHKEKCGCMAPRRAKDEESGADCNRAQGKGFLTPAAPRNNQRIPCRSSLPEFLQLNT